MSDMFGCKNKCLCYECCNAPSAREMSTAIIHAEYAQKIMRLEYQLEEAKRTIQDLAETNKHLSRAVSATHPKREEP